MNLTEVPIDYLKTRREFLKILNEGLLSVCSEEKSEKFLENLTNALSFTQTELANIDNELIGRGELLIKQLSNEAIEFTE